MARPSPQQIEEANYRARHYVTREKYFTSNNNQSIENICSPEQRKWLRDQVVKQGISAAEIIRRLINQAMGKDKH